MNKTLKTFAGLKFDNSYTNLPSSFFVNYAPVPVKNPNLIHLNKKLAQELGLKIKDLESKKGVDFLAGNYLPESAKPIALAYAGHQFGHFVPKLGDGRAILLGEILDKNNQRFDIQLKGSGPTPFSRNGDGRAPLSAAIREHIVSEAMHNLRISTTRSLAVVSTGESVFREEELPGGILTRIAKSHIRIGTFEYFAAQGDIKSIKILADYTILRHYPDCLENANPYLALLSEVMKAQAKLVAKWMGVGFIHGVMNTDNMSISGQTIDYGPCAFIDHYDPNKSFSFIDRSGRYAFANQGQIAAWNLARFAETLLPLIDPDINKAIKLAQNMIESFEAIFAKEYQQIMAQKLGLVDEDGLQEQKLLISGFLDLLAKYQIDYTLAFRYLTDFLADSKQSNEEIKELFLNKEDLAFWLKNWLNIVNKSSIKDRVEAMRQANPIFIPRNHLVEVALNLATKDNNFAPMLELMQILENPYLSQNVDEKYHLPPACDQRVLHTFCGT